MASACSDKGEEDGGASHKEGIVCFPFYFLVTKNSLTIFSLLSPIKTPLHATARHRYTTGTPLAHHCHATATPLPHHCHATHWHVVYTRARHSTSSLLRATHHPSIINQITTNSNIRSIPHLTSRSKSRRPTRTRKSALCLVAGTVEQKKHAVARKTISRNSNLTGEEIL